MTPISVSPFKTMKMESEFPSLDSCPCFSVTYTPLDASEEPPTRPSETQQQPLYFPFSMPDYSAWLPAMEVSIVSLLGGFKPLPDMSSPKESPRQPRNAGLAIHDSANNNSKRRCASSLEEPWPVWSRKAARSKKKRTKNSKITHFTRIKPRSWKRRSSTKKPTTGSRKKELSHGVQPLRQNLKLLMQKELKNSDVSSLGRIVVPKKYAELNLPQLHCKEGILMKLRELDSNQTWGVRYRFWPNSTSRMYVIENIGDFIQKFHLRAGDYVFMYKDDPTSEFLISGRKKAEESLAASVCDAKKEVKEGDKQKSSNNVLRDATNLSGSGGRALMSARELFEESGSSVTSVPDDMFGIGNSLPPCVTEHRHCDFSSLEMLDSFKDSEMLLFTEEDDMKF